MSKRVAVVFSAEHADGATHQVLSWMKSRGDFVHQHEPLLEVSSDKATLEIGAPVTGILTEILKESSAVIHLGEPLAYIDAQQEDTLDPTVVKVQTPTTHCSDSILSPSVRKLLASYGLKAAQIKGKGEGGRIRAEDVVAYAEGEQRQVHSRRVPHSTMRRSIASHMTDSVRVAPHVTAVIEVDMSAVMQHRASLIADYREKGVHLTPLSYVVMASIAGLRAVPEMNSQWHHDVLEIFEVYHIAVAVALDDRGLVAPVLRNADQLNLLEVARQLGLLAEQARSKELGRADLEGATFTISNHGRGGSLLAAPVIINQPQSAILGLGRIEDRAVVVKAENDKRIEIRPCAYVTVTIDHRVVDGYQADKFLSVVKKTLEQWRL